jgi:hypothetical protein
MATQKRFVQDDGKGRDEDDFDQLAAAEEICTREEIQFGGKENIEGYACLVNVFIRQLSVPFDHVALINVDNHDEEFESTHTQEFRQGQIYFQSTLKFQNAFTTLVGKQLRANRGSMISTINVKINFNKLKKAPKGRLKL